jgi:hypothetical protein
MVWFQQKKDMNDVDLAQCNPIIVNQTAYSIVLFLDRGVLYNKQVLAPGEAVAMTRNQTAGTVVPYKIHAVVGDDKALPTRRQSLHNALSTAVIPTAFIVGTFMAAASAGTLTGPSAALGRVAGGVVVKGMVIDSAALAAGSLTASRAAYVADKILEKRPQNFAVKSGLYMPGNRFVVVRGGVEEHLTITCLKEKQFRQIPLQSHQIKMPMDTLQDKIEYYTPSIFKSTTTKGDGTALPALGEAKQEQVETTTTTTPRLPAAATLPAAALEEETEEDRQLRQAIEESLTMEVERKQRDELYNKQLKDHEKRKAVTLF